MYNEMLPLTIVLGLSAVYLLNWRSSLKKRQELQKMVLDIIESKSRSQAAKNLALSCFIMSGRHFVILAYFKWALTRKIFRKIGLNEKIDNGSERRDREFERSFKKNELNEIIFPMLKKAIEVNLLISPIQYLFVFILLMLSEIYTSIFCPTSNRTKAKAKTHVAHALLNYSEHTI